MATRLAFGHRQTWRVNVTTRGGGGVVFPVSIEQPGVWYVKASKLLRTSDAARNENDQTL